MAIKPDQHRILRDEQPIRRARAFSVGVMGTLAMMALMDVCFMLGLTSFTFETYLGAVISPGVYGPRDWLAGFFANLLAGGIFGLIYAYAFEYLFRRSGPRIGLLTGLIHAAVAAAIVFPFLGVAHEEFHTGMYSHFGFFGSGLESGTPLLLLVSHLLYGMTLGTLYGPVRAVRLREELHEPGELFPVDAPGTIDSEEDSPERYAG
jgi:hypothetical protein